MACLKISIGKPKKSLKFAKVFDKTENCLKNDPKNVYFRKARVVPKAERRSVWTTLK